MVMRSKFLSVSFGLALGLVTVTGCGGGASSAKVSSAEVERSPMEELQAIPKEIDKDVASLTKPIEDAQVIADELTDLPKKHHISAGDMAAMSKATFDNGKVDVKVNGEVSAEAKAEIEATLKKLSVVVAELKSTPERVAAVTSKIVKVTAKVPLLATEITSKATVTVSNPFASSGGKAKAAADLSGIQKAQGEVTKSLGDAQSKVSGIPALATGALGKLGASFASTK